MSAVPARMKGVSVSKPFIYGTHAYLLSVRQPAAAAPSAAGGEETRAENQKSHEVCHQRVSGVDADAGSLMLPSVFAVYEK
jgi:hypothetical protein